MKWGEGFFLGKWWRTREAVIGTKDAFFVRVRFVVWVVIEDGIVKDLNKYEEFRGSGIPSRVRSMRI